MVMFKKACAEFIGTFVLVFVACGVAAATGGDLVATSLAFGLVIVAMAYSIGRVSGCHINPAVSLACLLQKRMTCKEFCVYVCSQGLGGFVGGFIFSLLHIDIAINLGPINLGTIIVSAIGACIVIFIFNKLFK